MFSEKPSFDRPTNQLYIADVGQGAVEEIDAVSATSAPLNYGWKIMEGPQCYGASSCDKTGMTLPVHSYTHSDGCSVTGGFVYHGTRLTGLQGTYFYSDYCAGWLRSFVLQNGVKAFASMSGENPGPVSSISTTPHPSSR